MTEGRRERKKQRTRQALIDAAVDLFETDGYDETTVARIAEAADVSTRTFFLHFPAKEDVLLANAGGRIDLAVHAVAHRADGESVTDVLRRAVERMVGDAWQTDLSDGLAALRARLIATEPALQAKLVHRLLAGQTELTEALCDAFGGRISRLDAAALVGAVLGAVNAAALVSLRRGDRADEVRAAMLRAAEIALGTRDIGVELG
ncbi:TetR/AcrR family transcriptional regulator [Kibdelosporangium phytohabitans]|uniref:TetR/AcrR family transcriptional regulator n=1 Tax=Kibdelosporangium phytohabitans TaxID=860235 RepID=UPI001A07972B|nr:TetR/AcrR family transcriptional regulator [Kibdelosporangium phytohabitans]MBE1467278.1 AcrR family transcriptional regulator [Kibdelosporangium phytohabitans]